MKLIDNLDIPGGLIRIYKDNHQVSAQLKITYTEFGKDKKRALEKLVLKLETMSTMARRCLDEVAESATTPTAVIKASGRIDNNSARLTKFRSDNTDNEYDAYQASLEQQEQLILNKE